MAEPAWLTGSGRERRSPRATNAGAGASHLRDAHTGHASRAGKRARTLVATAAPMSDDIRIRPAPIPAISEILMIHESTKTRDEYADFLRRFEWAHFATFTATPSAPDRLHRAFRQTIRRLERRAQGPIHFFVVLELGAAGVPHLHALLTGTVHLPCEEIARSWWLGHSDVRRFDASRGGIFYLTKSIHHEDADYDLSPRLTKRQVSSGAFSSPETCVQSDEGEWDEFPLLKELREEGLHMG